MTNTAMTVRVSASSILATGLLLGQLVLGCTPGGSSSSSSGGSKDAATACTDLCTKDGYSSSRVDVQSNETNCFCSNGSGPVQDADCRDMCSSMGKGSSQTFSSRGGVKDSCQCS